MPLAAEAWLWGSTKDESRYWTRMITFSILGYDEMTYSILNAKMSSWDYKSLTRPLQMAYSTLIKQKRCTQIVLLVPESKTLVQHASLWLTRKITLKVSRKWHSCALIHKSWAPISQKRIWMGEERNVEIAGCHQMEQAFLVLQGRKIKGNCP